MSRSVFSARHAEADEGGLASTTLLPVSRTWAELLGEPEAPAAAEEERRGFLSRLRDSLGKSRKALIGQLAAAAFDPGDEEAWERLEEALIAGDVGARATAELVRRLEERVEVIDLGRALAEEIALLMDRPGGFDLSGRPSVILVVGVNGTGKTTTIGKLASVLNQHGRSVLRPRPTPTAPPPRSSSRSGPGGQRPTSSAARRAATRPRLPSTRSRPPRRAGATW